MRNFPSEFRVAYWAHFLKLGDLLSVWPIWNSLLTDSFSFFLLWKGKRCGETFHTNTQTKPRLCPCREGMGLTWRQRRSVLCCLHHLLQRESQGREHCCHPRYHKTTPSREKLIFDAKNCRKPGLCQQKHSQLFTARNCYLLCSSQTDCTYCSHPYTQNLQINGSNKVKAVSAQVFEKILRQLGLLDLGKKKKKKKPESFVRDLRVALQQYPVLRGWQMKSIMTHQKENETAGTNFQGEKSHYKNNYAEKQRPREVVQPPSWAALKTQLDTAQMSLVADLLWAGCWLGPFQPEWFCVSVGSSARSLQSHLNISGHLFPWYSVILSSMRCKIYHSSWTFLFYLAFWQ